MNMAISLDAAAKIGEVVGAMAVVVGLLFVGLEIRGNTVAQQFAATQVLVAEYNAAITSINDSDFICIYIAGSSNFKNLPQKDKIRYSIQMQPIFRTFEQLHYSAMQGTIDSNVHSGFRRQFAAIMKLPGNQQFWSARHDWFGDEFQEYTNEVIAVNKSMDPATIAPANFALEECT
jgi:hypothetical protein